MSYLKSQVELQRLILAGYPLAYVVTDDERPVIDTINVIAEHCPIDYNVFTWNPISGMVSEGTAEPKMLSAQQVLKEIVDYPADGIFILHDFHHYLKKDENGGLHLKETVLTIKEPFTDAYKMRRYQKFHGGFNKHVIITSPEVVIPQEVNKLLNLVYFGMPGKKEIETMLDEVVSTSDKNSHMSFDEKARVINASLGLSETEIFNAYAYSMIENSGVILPASVTKRKKQVIEKNGLLEYQEPTINLDDVGGLNALLDWTRKRKIAYNEEVRQKYNLDYPKGLLMTGVQGCGKSFTAKAIASYLEVPFLAMDMGALRSKWVGESESNIRKALELAESISPCVLFVDEIEKGVSDPSGGDSHEVSNRILSTMLTWLQEKTKPVFVIATSNNIDLLPPELLRKGRFDEIFFIDLPDDNSKRDIFELKLRSKEEDPSQFDLSRIVQAAEGFSGSEIESVVNESMFEAAYQNTHLTTDIILHEINRTSPLSKTMSDKVAKIRNWAKQHDIRPAD